MYNEFYGLKVRPFSLTPDPSFIVYNPKYKVILEELYYGLVNNQGLIVLTGEVGTGKTTALRWILTRLDTTNNLICYIENPLLSVDEFYYFVAHNLGLKDWNNKAQLLIALKQLVKQRYILGYRTIIIVDEAQDLDQKLLEEIRLLLNFESNTDKYLQMILCGQPELITQLFKRHELRQLKQRVALYCEVKPLLTAIEVDSYIRNRLEMAGSTQPYIFMPAAVDFIFKCSNGLPRSINNICEKALVEAYKTNDPLIGRAIIEDVAEDLHLV